MDLELGQNILLKNILQIRELKWNLRIDFVTVFSEALFLNLIETKLQSSIFWENNFCLKTMYYFPSYCFLKQLFCYAIILVHIGLSCFQLHKEIYFPNYWDLQIPMKWEQWTVTRYSVHDFEMHTTIRLIRGYISSGEAYFWQVSLVLTSS